MFDRIGRIPELACPAQQCTSGHFHFPFAASRELIDDQAPYRYDPLFEMLWKLIWV
jgi:hypothetical protein